MRRCLFLLAIIAVVLFSCESKVELEKPTVVTFPVSEITESSAVCGGEVVSDGGAEVTARGVCWSINQNPTLEDLFTTDGNGIGTFTSNLSNLDPNTQYYVRAYATNSEGISYGDEYSFTSLEITDEEDDSGNEDSGDGDGNEDEDDGNGNGDGNEDGDEVIVELPSVVTVDITEITETSAICGGEVVSDGGAQVTARGVCWSINQNPTLEDSYTTDGNGVGSFVSNISNLDPNTQYYIRAYATNELGTTYGDEIIFTTLEEVADDNGFINGYEYVDLGLPSGTKWATHNIGAASPSEYGEYYAWGEIETKPEYTQANSLTDGLPLTDISADVNHDAATVKWGATWRIPTRAEMEELGSECVWEWTNENDVFGYKITGKNGNHIFLPAAGFLFGSSEHFVNQYGYYWTSISGTENYNGGFSLCFGNESYEVAWYFRYAGLTIRPVSD